MPEVYYSTLGHHMLKYTHCVHNTLYVAETTTSTFTHRALGNNLII